MNAGITRRNFLAGAAATGGVAAMGLIGCSPASPASSADDPLPATDQTDSIGSPENIDISAIANTFDAEVVIVGAGFSGQCAAASAIDHGAKSVILLEKGDTYRIGGALCGTVNSRLHKQLDAIYDPAMLYREYMKAYNYCIDSHMAMDWAYGSGAIQDWLFDKCDEAGVDYTIYTTYPEDFDFDREIASTYRLGVAIDTTAHDDMTSALKVLSDYSTSHGAEIKYRTPGQQLVQDDTGRVTGVIAVNENGDYELYQASRGVILCTGDYGGNVAMCRQFLEPEHAELAEQGTCYAMKSAPTDTPHNTGDGHKMACWAGGHMEPGIHAAMTWNTTGFFNMPFLQVNKQGERFFNEGLTASFWPRVIARQPDKISWQITDATFQEQVAEMTPATPDGLQTSIAEDFVKAWEEDSGWVSADTIEELARKIEVPPEKLAATIERYNSLSGDIDYDQGKLGKYILPLTTPPFKAALIGSTLAVTLGGIVVNDRLQVRKEDGSAIDGLYLAGNTVGRRYSRYYEDILVGNSNAFALVHGYLAGQYIME